MMREPKGRKNALKHGAYAQHVILPDESADEFQQLHRSLIQEWKPTGTFEEETVFDLARCFWTKRRSDRLFCQQVAGAQIHPRQADLVHLMIFAEYLKGAQTGSDVEVPLPEYYGKWIDEQCPRHKFTDDKSWIQSLRATILSLIASQRFHIGKEKTTSAFKAKAAARICEITAQKIAIDDRIDARIDKNLKRLAQSKTFKQIVERQASESKMQSPKLIVPAN